MLDAVSLDSFSGPPASFVDSSATAGPLDIHRTQRSTDSHLHVARRMASEVHLIGMSRTTPLVTTSRTSRSSQAQGSQVVDLVLPVRRADRNGRTYVPPQCGP